MGCERNDLEVGASANRRVMSLAEPPPDWSCWEPAGLSRSLRAEGGHGQGLLRDRVGPESADYLQENKKSLGVVGTSEPIRRACGSNVVAELHEREPRGQGNMQKEGMHLRDQGLSPNTMNEDKYGRC